MISRYGVFAQRARNPLAVQAELIAGFPHGLRTSVPPSMLAATELAECVNFQINRNTASHPVKMPSMIKACFCR